MSKRHCPVPGGWLASTVSLILLVSASVALQACAGAPAPQEPPSAVEKDSEGTGREANPVEGAGREETGPEGSEEEGARPRPDPLPEPPEAGEAKPQPPPVPRREDPEARRQENRRAAERAWKEAMKAHEGRPWERAHRLSGNDIELRCNSSREVAEGYFKALQKINHELARFFRKARVVHYQNRPTSVFVYKTRQEFMEREKVPAGVGGIFDAPSGNISAYHGGFGVSGDTIGVLGRELAHRWEASVVGRAENIPPWVYHGLAICLGEGLAIPKKGRAKVFQIPRDRLRMVQGSIREGRHVKIRDLIRTPLAHFTQSHAAHAWSVVYMLVNTSKGNREAFNNLFNHCVSDRLTPKHFEDLCKGIGGVEVFEEKWKEWVLALEAPPAGKILDPGDVFRSDFCKVSVGRPDPSWEFVLGEAAVPAADRPAFQAALRKGDARIQFLSANNPEHLRADVAAARKEEELRESQRVLSRERVDANGYEAVGLVYETRGEEGGDPRERLHRVYVTTVPHIIVLEMAAPVETFADLRPDFEGVLRSLQLHFD